MGKVGSSSVARSLRTIKTDRPIYHVHFLNPTLVDEYEARRKQFLGTPREGTLKHIWQYQYINDLRKQGLINGHKWKIVTLVRDPIARNLSDFFEHIEVVPSPSKHERIFRSIQYDYEVVIEGDKPDKLIEIFFEKYDHDGPLRYFDGEFKEVLGIDLFASDFPQEKGYKIYPDKDFDVLLIRLENLNECITEAFAAFLDIDNLTLVNKNVGSQKEYADVYRQFKRSISLPESYLDRIYESKFSRHFYSDAEIAQFRAQWSRKPTA